MGIETSEGQEYTPPPPPDPPVEESENQRYADELEAAETASEAVDAERPDAGQTSEHTPDELARMEAIRDELAGMDSELTPEQKYDQMDDVLAEPDMAKETNDLLRDSDWDTANGHVEGGFIIQGQDGVRRLEPVAGGGANEDVTWPSNAPLRDGEQLIGVVQTQPVSEAGPDGHPVRSDDDVKLAGLYDGVPRVVVNDNHYSKFL